MGGGGVNCSRQASLSQFFSLLFSDHFVSPVTDNLLFLELVEERKNARKNVQQASVNLGSACK